MGMKQWTKKIKGILMAAFICAAVMTAVPEYAYADTASVTIAVSASSIQVGDSVTVSVRVSSGNTIGSYSMAVTYDSSVLEYTGGSGNGGGGTVLIAGYGDGSATSLSASLTFRAIANGSTTVTTSGGEAYGWDESTLDISHAGATIRVVAPAASTTAASGDNQSSDASGTTASSNVDTTLKSLEISPGTLEPSFSSTVTSYTVSLPEDTTSIIVSAVANNPNATVSVSHNDDLEPGANKTYIVVTGEDGSQRTYVLNINCGDVEDAGTIEINGVAYVFATDADMENVTIPEGYSMAEAAYGESTISVYESSNHLLQIVYLLNEEGEGQWFRYDADAQAFLSYVEFMAASNRYIILDVPEGVAIPEGYAAVEMDIQGISVTVYEKDGNAEFVLVYATNLYDDAGFYVYDTVESTFQRFVEQEPAVEETIEDATEEDVETEASAADQLRRLRILLYVLCGVSVVLLGIVIGMWKGFRKSRSWNEDGSEDESSTLS